MSVHVEKKDFVTTLIIDRPGAKNAIDRDTASALAQAVRDFEADKGSHIAVLWGKNGTFCSGADLKKITGNKANRLEPTGDAPLGPTRMFTRKPVIAAISGYAVAGGLELALWADLRVMESSAILGVFCRRWGVPLIDGGTVRLPRLIGLSRAMDLILTGRPVGANEALSMGLANRIVDDGTSRQAAEELARQIATFPQECLLSDRQSAYEQCAMSLETAMQNEFRLGAATISKSRLAAVEHFVAGSGRGGTFR